MTKAKRRIWAGTNHDLANANHRTVTRVTGSIPSAPDAGERLAAVKAAATRKNNPERMTPMPMHPAAKDELLNRLKRLTGEEREQLMAEASQAASQADGQERAANALSSLIRNRED